MLLSFSVYREFCFCEAFTFHDASSSVTDSNKFVAQRSLPLSYSMSSTKAEKSLRFRKMISTKTDQVLEEALMRVAAAGGNKEEVVVHLVTEERCFSAFVTPASHKNEDVTQDCVDMMPNVTQEIIAKPEVAVQPQNHQIALRTNFSLPSVVIHGATSNSGGYANMSPKSNKKKKKKSKGDSDGIVANSAAVRSQSFHVRSQCTIPLLKLPDDYDEDAGGSNPPPIHVEAATSDEGESVEVDENKSISKKRRKSLVNLLFSSSSKAENTGHNSLDAGMTPHGGQRLHFRRLSDIICRLGGNKDEEKQPLPKQTSKDDSDLATIDSPSGISGGAAAGLTLRQLFPYRRRRSSVSHLDNTEQFRETKEEYLMSARRRMSSFPPSDGDESAIVLEKIHSMGKIEIGMGAETPTTEGCGTPTSHSSPFKLLRRGPGGLFPTSKSKKSKWKSSTDIPASLVTVPLSTLSTNNNGNSSNSNSNSNISNVSTNPPVSDSSPVVTKNSTTVKEPPGSNKRSGWGQSSSSSSFLRPSFPLMSRRGSSPLESELNALRKTISEGPGEPPRNVVVFPRRRLEDVPGIFIPGRSKGDSVANLLGVRLSKDDDRRRHSISDPILVQQQISSIKQLPALRPRSPYLADQRY
jgi:hypothetical protein